MDGLNGRVGSITGRTGSINRFSVYDLHGEGVGPPTNIFEAAERGNASYIIKAIERSMDIDINQRDKFQRTGLHWAAEMGHIDAAEALIDFGCDISLVECNGRTAVHLAARGCDAEMLKLLLSQLPDAKKAELVNQPDSFGITPVFLALQKGEEGSSAFEYLMLCGGKYNEAFTANGR